MPVENNTFEVPSDKIHIRLEPLEKMYDSEEHYILLDNGEPFTYKYHTVREKGNGASENLVIIIPGAEDNGEGHLKSISQRTEHAFDSITFSYPEPFSIANVSEGLVKILTEHPSTKVVLYGASYGGSVLHRVLEQVDGSNLKNIAGVIYQSSAISKDHLSPVARRAAGIPRVIRAVAAMREPKSDDDDLNKKNSKALSEMINQLPNNIPLANGDYPRRAILCEDDRLINNKKLAQTLAEEAHTSAENICITVKSDRDNKLGHVPEDWGIVHHISAELIDEFLA